MGPHTIVVTKFRVEVDTNQGSRRAGIGDLETSIASSITYGLIEPHLIEI